MIAVMLFPLSLSEKGSDPLEASRFQGAFCLAGEGQTPFRIGSKQTIVLITDKYVHDESDFAAGSAAVLLFKNISESGDETIRLLDATGDPYDSENIAQDEFERKGIKQLKAGAEKHEKVVTMEGDHYLRMMTPVPVVMEKCIMCHSHY